MSLVQFEVRCIFLLFAIVQNFTFLKNLVEPEILTFRCSIEIFFVGNAMSHEPRLLTICSVHEDTCII